MCNYLPLLDFPSCFDFNIAKVEINAQLKLRKSLVLSYVITIEKLLTRITKNY